MGMAKDYVENCILEGQQLEYKNYSFEDGSFKSLKDNRDKLMKEIVAFANAEGGTIILGIAEGENHNPSELVDTKVQITMFENWQQSFMSYVKAKIRPVIHGIKCSHEFEDGNNLIIIEVPKSIVSPHSFYDGNKDEFHIRYGNITTHMSIDDLRKSFTERERIQQSVDFYIRDRIAKLLSLIYSENNTMLLVNIVPEWSMYPTNSIDINQFYYNYDLDLFVDNDGAAFRRGTPRYTAEGLIIEEDIKKLMKNLILC